MIYLADGLELELRQWMGQPSALSESAAQVLLAKSKADGRLLCEIVYNQLELRYLSRSRQKLSSAENWRWEPQPHLDDKNKSAEVNLEKKLIKQCNGNADWTNAIPTASGLFDDGGRRANIDLAVRDGDVGAFMELKWNSNHPIYAAIEIIGYAMAWVQARVNAESMGYIKNSQLRPALDFREVNWAVVAPAKFYTKFDGLDRFEQSLNQGVQEFTRYKLNGSVSSSFRFITLPTGVDPFYPKPELIDFLRKSALSTNK